MISWNRVRMSQSMLPVPGKQPALLPCQHAAQLIPLVLIPLVHVSLVYDTLVVLKVVQELDGFPWVIHQIQVKFYLCIVLQVTHGSKGKRLPLFILNRILRILRVILFDALLNILLTQFKRIILTFQVLYQRKGFDIRIEYRLVLCHNWTILLPIFCNHE